MLTNYGKKITGPLLKQLFNACQDNPWLKHSGVDFEDGLMLESDYPLGLQEYDDIADLMAFFEHGNWSIRSAVKFEDLIFVNQVNGGDEWWTLKIAGSKLIPFESISFERMIARNHGEFAQFIARLINATPEQCQALNY